MPTSFPSGLDDFTNPTASDELDSVTVPHATQHANVNDAIEAVEARVGITGSGVITSHAYRLDNIHLEPQGIVSFTTTARTLIASDIGKLVHSSTTITTNYFIPLMASVSVLVGQFVDITQQGAGQLNFSANAGVVIRAATNSTWARAQHSAITLRKVSTDIWLAAGDTA